MDKDAYIKKLERRIHNQRVALRENWMIVEQRADGMAHYRKPYWFRKCLKLMKEIRGLKESLEDLKK